MNCKISFAVSNHVSATFIVPVSKYSKIAVVGTAKELEPFNLSLRNIWLYSSIVLVVLRWRSCTAGGHLLKASVVL